MLGKNNDIQYYDLYIGYLIRLLNNFKSITEAENRIELLKSLNRDLDSKIANYEEMIKVNEEMTILTGVNNG